jgi:gliding motility-associated-like protein
MKHLILLLSFIFYFIQLKSQCFQIQSILVDACDGSNEGKNEMVTFQVGTTSLNTSNLSVNWPNNNWLGLTKNAGTAANIATVNATIQGCGFLKEPVGGVLPANSKVLLVTSTAWAPLAQSFANLTDTLIVIFQSAGNTQGHFANYQSGGGLRTLSLSFSSPSGCSDAVNYDRALLTTQAGIVGGQDGGAVEFTASGAATYVNYGCQAPFIPLSVDAGINKTICVGATQTFTALTSGSYSSVNWSLGSGALGTFSPTNSLTTIYTPGVSESGTVKLYCTIIKACGTQTTSVKDSVLLNITPLPTVSITPSNVSICSGQNATVTATANTAVTYSWSTGVSSNSVSLNSAGVYTVSANNTCGIATATVSVSITSVPTLSIVSSAVTLCPSGQTATLSLVGGTGAYTWSNGSNTSTTTINSPGIYSATVATPGCGNAVANISLGSAPLPVISILAPATTSLCSGSSIILTATSNEGNYLWSNGAITNTVAANSPMISVTSTNVCGSSQATQTLNVISLPTVSISPASNILCPGTTATLTANASNANNYLWSTGDVTSVILVNTTGVKTVTVTNACGTDTASANITSISFPPLVLTSSSNTICPNETATLTVSGGVPLTTGSPILYAWSNSTSTGSMVTTSGGLITVSNTNVCGTNTQTINVSIINSVSADVIANPISGILPVVVSFTNNSSNANSYSWNFGNGNTANTTTVSSQTYSNAGTYTVYLTASSGACSDMDYVVITVLNEESTLYVPNAFTPNGDSINDIFLVGATNIKEFNMIIFDRWGLKMFESSDINVGWDGTVNGKVVADGTYFHLINAKDVDGKEIKKQGTITLFK